MTLRIDLADYLGHPNPDRGKELVVHNGNRRIILTQDGQELDSIPNPDDDDVLVYIPKSLGTHIHDCVLESEDKLFLKIEEDHDHTDQR